jgi:signal transduction histidine kinase
VGQHYVDSLETKLILVDNDEKLLILDELIPFYFRNDPLRARISAEKMGGYAMQQNVREYLVKAQRYLGLSISHLSSEHDKALDKCFEVEKTARFHGFINELILTKLAIADIYQQIGNNTMALKYQLDAYHLSDSIKSAHLQSHVLINLSITYMDLDEVDKAELYLKDALKNANLNDQIELIADIHIQFGILYSRTLNYEEALDHFLKALSNYKKNHREMQAAIALYNIGDCYFHLDQNDKSFQYHLEALEIRNRIDDHLGKSESYNKIGLLCIENEEYERAIRNLKIGLANAEMINSNTLMQESFDYLSQTYMKLNDFENAIQYTKNYVEISDLIYTEANERKIEEITNQKEIERREEEIRSLEQESKLKEQELANSRSFNALLVALLVVILISVFFFVRSYRDRKKINKELQRINDKVLKQNEELSEVNKTKDKFFSIIGHDLKGPLNSLTSFSQLLINHTASLTEEEIRTIAKDLDKSLKNLYELLENLLGWARSQTGRMEFTPEEFNVADVINENIKLLSKAALNKKIKIERLVDDELWVYADLNSVRTVIRNLLSNAIKFTGEDGVISIFADEWKDRIEIGIQDTGVGMSASVMRKLFDIGAKQTTLGTNKEKGTGLGLILCKEFIERNNGALSVDSKRGVGSTFKFSLVKARKHPLPQLQAVNQN